jgi:hypothetical protein
MSRGDLLFAVGATAGTLAVPGLLVLGQPLEEPRADLGYAAGWSLALLLVVPSYVIMSRVSRDPDDPRFFKALLGGMVGRFVLALVAMTLFATLVDHPPVKAFLLTFFLGWLILTGLELTSVMGRSRRGGTKEA